MVGVRAGVGRARPADRRRAAPPAAPAQARSARLTAAQRRGNRGVHHDDRHSRARRPRAPPRPAGPRPPAPSPPARSSTRSGGPSPRPSGRRSTRPLRRSPGLTGNNHTSGSTSDAPPPRTRVTTCRRGWRAAASAGTSPLATSLRDLRVVRRDLLQHPADHPVGARVADVEHTQHGTSSCSVRITPVIVVPGRRDDDDGRSRTRACASRNVRDTVATSGAVPTSGRRDSTARLLATRPLRARPCRPRRRTRRPTRATRPRWSRGDRGPSRRPRDPDAGHGRLHRPPSTAPSRPPQRVHLGDGPPSGGRPATAALMPWRAGRATVPFVGNAPGAGPPPVRTCARPRRRSDALDAHRALP